MEPITQDQFNTLLTGQIPSTLDEHVKSDIRYLKTILLTQQGNNYYLEFIELDELHQEEIDEIHGRGKLVTIR